jgi:hypothetical protein
MKTQIGRSIATLSATNIFLIALASPAGAGSDYSRIDRRCITGIDSNVAIDLPTAAQIQEMPVGTPIAQVTALAGTKAYCQTAEKTAPGGTWAQPFVLPIVVQTIAAPPEVLIVYVAQGQLAGVERWNVAPPRSPVRQPSRAKHPLYLGFGQQLLAEPRSQNAQPAY